MLGGADDEHPLLGGTQIGQRRVVCREDGASVSEHAVSQLGERDAATGLLHDGPADDGLDPPDVLAHGGLRQVQHCRCAVKSATVGDRHDAAQRCDVERLSHAATVLRSAITIKIATYGAPRTRRSANRSPIEIVSNRH